MADLNRRQTAVNSLRETQRFVEGNGFANAPLERLRVTLANVRRVSANFAEIHDRLIGAQIPQAEFNQHETLRAEIENLVTDLETRLLIQIGILAQPAAAPVQPAPVGPNPAQGPEMRYLLTQKIENTWGEFDGTLSKWKAFHDMFVSAVHEAGYLTNVFKFQQLVKSLKGEAAEVLEGWEISDANYPMAWDRLKTVYHLPHQTATQLVNKLAELPKIEKANRKQLQHLSNVTNSVKLQMNGLGYDTQQSEIMFLATLENKLDRTTRRDWELNRQNAPTLTQFLEFVDRQARIAPEISIDVKRSNNGNGNENHKRHQAGQNPSSHPYKKFRTENQGKMETRGERKKENGNFEVKCPVKECGLSHYLYRCPKYLARSRDEREKFLKSNKLCLNCLRPGHFAKFCGHDGCTRCEGKKHNSTICAGNPFLSKTNMVKTGKLKREIKEE